MTKQERYLRNQEPIKTRAIYKIFQAQKDLFCDMLEAESKSISLSTKKIGDDVVKPFIKKTEHEVPDYLVSVLPKIMTEGAKSSIKRYKDLLPVDYSLVFDLPTEPAAMYLADLEKLHLSDFKGSINRTTNDEIRKLIENGVAEWQSYGSIAKTIREIDPFVFSKGRARTIATTEMGRAYGWANHEPGQVLQDEGYVLVKEWTTSEDDKVRPTHMLNQEDGQIPFEATFSGTDDDYAPSTNDINCRCTSSHEIVGIADGKSIVPIAKGTSPIDIKKQFDIIKKRV